MQSVIPIFPLDLVLFPRQELPLRVFEPRYKQLVDDCMLGNGRFGVCLIDDASSVNGWNAPHLVGTIAKITGCKDVSPDGLELDIQAIGRNSFRIKEIIPPLIAKPADYDPHSLECHHEVARLHDKVGTEAKMYIQARVEMIRAVDGDVSLDTWNTFVELWKEKVVRQAYPRIVEPHTLNHVLEQYYLVSDIPTIDYVYSLAALGSGGPDDLQPILEAKSMPELVKSVERLLRAT